MCDIREDIASATRGWRKKCRSTWTTARTCFGYTPLAIRTIVVCMYGVYNTGANDVPGTTHACIFLYRAFIRRIGTPFDGIMLQVYNTSHTRTQLLVPCPAAWFCLHPTQTTPVYTCGADDKDTSYLPRSASRQRHTALHRRWAWSVLLKTAAVVRALRFNGRPNNTDRREARMLSLSRRMSFPGYNTTVCSLGIHTGSCSNVSW